LRVGGAGKGSRKSEHKLNKHVARWVENCQTASRIPRKASHGFVLNHHVLGPQAGSGPDREGCGGAAGIVGEHGLSEPPKMVTRLSKKLALGSSKIKGTRVEYLYRDAGNWKFWGEFDLAGNLTMRAVEKWLLPDNLFVPDAVGIASLVPEIRNNDDHPLHAIWSMRRAMVSRDAIQAADFLERLKKGFEIGWFELCPWAIIDNTLHMITLMSARSERY
jgi:hypothetical protein